MDAVNTLRRRHLEFYVRFAEHHCDALEKGADPEDRLRRLDALRAELENIRSALEWAIDHDHEESALRLALATNLAWQAGRLWSEGRRWVTRCLAVRSDRDELTALGYRVLGALAAGGGDLEASEDAFAEELDIRRSIGDEAAIADPLGALAWRHMERGDIEGALRLNDEALSIAVRLEDRLQEARNRFQRAWLIVGSDSDGAAEEAKQALRLFEGAGNVTEAAWSARHLARLQRTLGNDVEESRLCRRAVELAREAKDPELLVPALVDLAETQLRFENPPERTQPLLEEALALARHAPDRSLEARVLSAMASVSEAAEQVDAARRLAEHAVETLNEESELGTEAALVRDSTLGLLSRLEVCAGDLDAALAHAQARYRFAISLFRGMWGYAVQALSRAAQIAHLRGDTAAELDAFVRTREIVAKHDDPFSRAYASVAQTAISLLRGEIEEARVNAERALSDTQPFASLAIEAGRLQARVAVAAGRYEDAAVISGETASRAEGLGDFATARACLLAGADAALRAGRPDEAKHLLDRAAPLSAVPHVPLQTMFVWLTGRFAAAIGHPAANRLFAAAEAPRRGCGLGGSIFAEPADISPDPESNIGAAVEEATQVLADETKESG